MSIGIEQIRSAALVTLRWPERRNALGPDEARQLTEAIVEASQLDVSAVILTGQSAFCAGGDLGTFSELSSRLTPKQIRTHVYGDIQAMIRVLSTVPVPTIAAVDGAAVGLGMDLALACDMRFIGPNGWLRQGWGRAGLISATGGTWFLERMAPGVIWRLLADQPRLTGELCQRLGLGENAEESAVDSALERADRLAELPDDVLRAYVSLAREGSRPTEGYLDRCADYQAEFIGSERFRSLAAGLL